MKVTSSFTHFTGQKMGCRPVFQVILEKTSNVTGHALHIPWGTKSGSSMYQFSLGITAGRYETHCPAWYLVASLENRHLAPMRTSLILPSWQLFPLSVLHGRTQNTGNSQNMSEFLMISSWALLSRILDEKIPASCSPPRGIRWFTKPISYRYSP